MRKQRGSFIVYSKAGYWTGRGWSATQDAAMKFECEEHFDAYLKARNLASQVSTERRGASVMYLPPGHPSGVVTLAAGIIDFRSITLADIQRWESNGYDQGVHVVHAVQPVQADVIPLADADANTHQLAACEGGNAGNDAGTRRKATRRKPTRRNATSQKRTRGS